MARAVTIVASGGLPVTNIDTAGALGVPLTPVSSGGVPITLVDSGGMPAVLVSETGSLFYGLAGIQPLHYWDFATNRALFNGADVGPVTATPGWSFTRATVGSAEDLAGNIVQFVSGEIRRTDRGLLIEGARTNLFLNSATGGTQSVTVAAVAHTLSFRGTGTITLTGTSTAGPLVGSGASTRVTLTFTPTAGSLTLTVSGSCTNVQLEEGAFASSWIPTAGASVIRNADALTVSSPGVNFPLSLWAEFQRAVDTGGTERLHSLDNGSEAENANIGMNASDLFRTAMTTGSVLQAGAPVAGALAIGTIYKGAGRLSLNSVQSALNGTLGTEDTVGNVPATPTSWRVGAGSDGLVVSYGYLRRAAIFNSALTDAQLQAITS
jgi:hypothetical protein